ncbi:hypothetical protein Syun_024825 [Stephania yunnanensis]|uniref:FPL domain-containing protein n=1 Tax=Stephania yunnanensis TaxID=152371 RepID=A0AAP0EQG9_9MAGN
MFDSFADTRRSLGFKRGGDRFSLEELRYLTDLLKKIQVVNEVNKDYVIEALRSMAEIVTYGDQHDPTFFEFFMEKQLLGDFVRILKISKTVSVAIQLLQTMSIMIQNFRSEHSIYFLFSNEHVNYLIKYSFDFNNEELLSYYISFLRAISGKLNKSTISLLVNTQNDEVISFPLYTEAIRFAFHEENMVRIAVRALTLNVYHVGDEAVNRYLTTGSLADYFSNLVTYFRKQCVALDGLVSQASQNPSPESTSSILAYIDEIEDFLYYFSDVISSGVPNLGRLITDNILQLLIFPLLLPSMGTEPTKGSFIGATTSLYLICCILRIVKTKDLANSIAVAFFCSPNDFIKISQCTPNGNLNGHELTHERRQLDNGSLGIEEDTGSLRVCIPNSSGSSQTSPAEDVPTPHCNDGSHYALSEQLLSYIVNGSEIQVSGSLTMLATLLQTKELDESMLDALGILPQRKQHKKLLLQALVGEGQDEEQLFSWENSSAKDGAFNVIDGYLQHLKGEYSISCSCREAGVSPRVHRLQVIDALLSLFCRSNISAETLWDGGWLLHQLLPYREAEIGDSYEHCTNSLLLEVRGIWPDLLLTVLVDEWKKCRKAIEASSPCKEPKYILLKSTKSSSDGESSLSAGERMRETVKVFVLHHQLQIVCSGGSLPDQLPVNSATDSTENSQALTSGIEVMVPRAGTEISLADAVPCRIAFERGKERHFYFLAILRGTAGWLLLTEELPLKNKSGIVRVAAPLAVNLDNGYVEYTCVISLSTAVRFLQPKIDDKHSKWLHLRIRPSTLPFVDPSKYDGHGKGKTRALIDGRWTLAFRDEESCKSALSMIVEKMHHLRDEVGRRLDSLLNLDRSVK